MTEPARQVDERRYDPPRNVEVELAGQWWPGVQHAWRLTSDRDFWVADVEFSAQYDWAWASTSSACRRNGCGWPTRRTATSRPGGEPGRRLHRHEQQAHTQEGDGPPQVRAVAGLQTGGSVEGGQGRR
jgi:hypothetical protein